MDLSVLDTLRETFSLPSLLVLFALAALSILAVAVSVYKWLQFLRLGVGKRRNAEQILDFWLTGNPNLALQMAGERKSVLARILIAVFSGLRAQPNAKEYAEEPGRQTAVIELAAMTDRMRTLEMVVQSAPMLGLLGTVIGMIEAFSSLAGIEGGAVDPTILAGGIYTALSTTAVGLTIAIIAFFVQNMIEARIERERNLIDTVISAAIHGRFDPNSS